MGRLRTRMVLRTTSEKMSLKNQASMLMRAITLTHLKKEKRRCSHLRQPLMNRAVMSLNFQTPMSKLDMTSWVVLKLRRELCPHLKIILKMRRRPAVTTRKRPSSKVVSNLKRDKRTLDLQKKREVEEQLQLGKLKKNPRSLIVLGA